MGKWAGSCDLAVTAKVDLDSDHLHTHDHAIRFARCYRDFRMGKDVAEYWRRYEVLLDTLVSRGRNPARVDDILAGMIQLAQDAEEECRILKANHEQLRLWTATFWRLCADLSNDLGLAADAIVDFRESLKHTPDDLETRVGLIRVLACQPSFWECCSELNRLRELDCPFSSSNDAESAEKVLEVLCSRPEFSQHVDEAVLRGVLRAIANKTTMGATSP